MPSNPPSSSQQPSPEDSNAAIGNAGQRSDQVRRVSQIDQSSDRLQVSFTMMFAVVGVFALLSAALVYAAKVPIIQEELSTLLGRDFKTESVDGEGNKAWASFIVFIVMMPLLTACTISIMVNVLRYFDRR
ncbi:hypothetical protein SV7mr_16020 [Stieleria bergensis]|uniref:Uncharacterized protein n=1 Tax=Stieleria bergensis TaxID=2528025 RepID=A0A517SSK7_9BACT|nr:hypothetical protein SV7mr_16020 [Planctomycetes bacterium SV_7m_r]